jgi:hypothetical protein
LAKTTVVRLEGALAWIKPLLRSRDISAVDEDAIIGAIVQVKCNATICKRHEQQQADDRRPALCQAPCHPVLRAVEMPRFPPLQPSICRLQNWQLDGFASCGG